jgi:outer membrane protein TolC
MWKIIAVMGVTAAFSAAAETPLRLEDVTREALTHNPEILAAQKRYEAARQRPTQASSLPDPMLSVGYNSTGNPLPGSGIGTDPVANAGFSVTQPLFWPGKRKLRGEIAEREADAGLEEYRAVELGVTSRVKQAYYRLRNAYASTEILGRNRDLLSKFLRITEARYSVGKAAQQDIFKAQTQLSIIETRIERLQQEINSRKAEINSLLNRPPNAPLAEPVDVEPRPLIASLDDLMAQVRRNAPDIRREQRMVERTELALNLARKDYYPD